MDFSFIMIPGFLVMSILFGIPAAFLTPYGILIGSWLFFLLGYGLFLYSKKRFLDAAKFFLTAAGGYWFFFIALLFSREQLDRSADIYGVFARAGFPFQALDLPVPPMGSGLPPVSSWMGMWGNVTVWIALAGILVFLFARFLPLKNTRKGFFIAVAIAATIPLLFSHTLVALWFD